MRWRRVGLFEIEGDSERIGDGGLRGGIIDEGNGVVVASVRFLACGARSDSLGYRFNIGVFDPFGAVPQAFEVQCVPVKA